AHDRCVGSDCPTTVAGCGGRGWVARDHWQATQLIAQRVRVASGCPAIPSSSFTGRYSMPQQLWEKLRRKGLRDSLRILRERFLYRHWVLLVLERELVTPLPLPPRLVEANWPAVTVTARHLPTLRRYFPAYLPTVTDLLKREGVTGFAHLDREGHAACMVWVSDRDYYDN